MQIWVISWIMKLFVKMVNIDRTELERIMPNPVFQYVDLGGNDLKPNHESVGCEQFST